MKIDSELMKKLAKEDYVFKKLYEAHGMLTDEMYGLIPQSKERSVLIEKIFAVMLCVVDKYRKDHPEEQ